MIVALGVGPGDPTYLTRRGAQLLADADVVAGFEAVLAIARPLIPTSAAIITLTYANQVEQLQLVAHAHHTGRRCVVVCMGDVHFSGFQLLERIEHACGHAVDTEPGISSAVVLASRAHVAFDDTTFVTFHRRGDLTPFRHHLVRALADTRNAIVIPRPWDFMPKDIAADLLLRGARPDHPVEVWEHLTQREAAWLGPLADCTADFSDMSIMLIRA